MTKLAKRRGEHPHGDTGQLILLGLFLVVWGADSFWLKFSVSPAASVPLWVRWVFFVVAWALAFYLTASGHKVLSVEHHMKHVMKTGAFKYVRHPLYLAALLFYLSMSFLTFSLFSLGMLVVMIFPFYQYIARYEERIVEGKFGQAYRSYQRKTGMWLQRLW